MNKQFEFSTILGLVLAFTLVGIAISSGDSEVGAFVDIKSILIVFGGTFFVTSACFTITDALKTIGIVWQTFFFTKTDLKEISKNLIKVSEIVKKQGVLELQNHKNLFPNDVFFKKYMSLVIDGVRVEEIMTFMKKEIESTDLRHEKSIDIIKKAAEIAPAMGLIGTLIGLVQMLGNLEDPTKIGPAMAIALLTTLYGAAIAYMVLLPLATKLERNSVKEVETMEFFSDAIELISKNQGPIKLEMKLNSYLPPEDRFGTYS